MVLDRITRAANLRSREPDLDSHQILERFELNYVTIAVLLSRIDVGSVNLVNPIVRIFLDNY